MLSITILSTICLSVIFFCLPPGINIRGYLLKAITLEKIFQGYNMKISISIIVSIWKYQISEIQFSAKFINKELQLDNIFAGSHNIYNWIDLALHFQ